MNNIKIYRFEKKQLKFPMTILGKNKNHRWTQIQRD